MKTLLSQCMKKIKRKRCVGPSLQAQTEGLENGVIAASLSKPYEKIKCNITMKD